jgi:hypothetical protein
VRWRSQCAHGGWRWEGVSPCDKDWRRWICHPGLFGVHHPPPPDPAACLLPLYLGASPAYPQHLSCPPPFARPLTCCGARRRGPLPPARPRPRTSSRSSVNRSSLRRKSSSSRQPLRCQVPWDRLNPSWPSSMSGWVGGWVGVGVGVGEGGGEGGWLGQVGKNRRGWNILHCPECTGWGL